MRWNSDGNVDNVIWISSFTVVWVLNSWCVYVTRQIAGLFKGETVVYSCRHIYDVFNVSVLIIQSWFSKVFPISSDCV